MKKRPLSHFGQQLKALRQARGLTQVELAKAIQSSQRALSYYENEAKYPPAEVLVELARVLKVSMDELLGIKKTEKIREEPATFHLWKKFQKIQTLTEKDRQAILRMINSLVDTKKR